MKAKLFYTLLLCCFSLQLLAQTNPLVGTWIEENTQTGLKEIKIISPTHVGFIVMDTKKDTMAFTGFGTYTVENNKYTENLEIANFTWDKNTKLQFDYKVEGDKLYQKGTITNADGSKEEINHTFTRVKLLPQGSDEIIGTWKVIDSKMADGKTFSSDPNLQTLRIITPTHRFQIRRSGEKVLQSMIFPYKKEGEKYISGTPEFSSHKLPSNTKLEVSFKPVADGKVQVNIAQSSNNILDYQRIDVMERVESTNIISTK